MGEDKEEDTERTARAILDNIEGAQPAAIEWKVPSQYNQSFSWSGQRYAALTYLQAQPWLVKTGWINMRNGVSLELHPYLMDLKPNPDNTDIWDRPESQYCKVCEVWVMYGDTYRGHLNGKKHNTVQRHMTSSEAQQENRPSPAAQQENRMQAYRTEHLTTPPISGYAIPSCLSEFAWPRRCILQQVECIGSRVVLCLRDRVDTLNRDIGLFAACTTISYTFTLPIFPCCSQPSDYASFFSSRCLQWQSHI